MADLLTLPEVRGTLATTEPLAAVSFATLAEDGRAAPYATYDDKWRKRPEDAPVTDPVPVWLTVPQLGQRYQLTFQAAQQLGSTCRIPQDLQVSVPAEYVESLVNWFLRQGLGERQLKLLLAGQGTDEHGARVPLAVAQTRATVQPFSNLALLDEALKVIEAVYGKGAAVAAEAHFTLYHDLEHTDLRLVVPGAAQEIGGDAWAPGVEITNSCIGLKQTTVTGLLCRLESSAVALDGAHTAGGFKRLNSTPAEAYEWAGEASRDVLDALEIAYANLGELAHREVGIDPGGFVESLAHEFRVPKAQVQRLTTLLEEAPGDLTMYAITALAGRAANMDGMKWRARAQLMAMAGHIVHAEGGRCSKDRPCYRALPPGFEHPA